MIVEVLLLVIGLCLCVHSICLMNSSSGYYKNRMEYYKAKFESVYHEYSKLKKAYHGVNGFTSEKDMEEMKKRVFEHDFSLKTKKKNKTK